MSLGVFVEVGQGLLECVKRGNFSQARAKCFSGVSDGNQVYRSIWCLISLNKPFLTLVFFAATAGWANDERCGLQDMVKALVWGRTWKYQGNVWLMAALPLYSRQEAWGG